jgi:hypothetical protein
MHFSLVGMCVSWFGLLPSGEARAGAFAEANARRADLRQYHGVVVDDRALEWRVESDSARARTAQQQARRGSSPAEGGHSGGLVSSEVGGRREASSRTVAASVGHDYARRATATTSAGGVDLGAVDALLATRLKAKKARRFEDADALRAALKVPEFLDMAMQLGFSFYLLTELLTFF